MSEILKTFTDRTTPNKPTWWLILGCGHWYHWTGLAAPKPDADIPCPNCAPRPVVVKPA